MGNWGSGNTGGASGGGYPNNVSAFAATPLNAMAILTWTDPADDEWTGTMIRRKIGGYPVNKADGVLVVDSVVRDQYAEDGYVDEGLDDGVTYYYQAFPRSRKGYCNNEANRVAATIAYVYPSALSAFSIARGNAQATLRFTLPDDAIGVRMVYKPGAYPVSVTDGTVIADASDGGAVNSYTVSGLVNGTTYYFRAFPFNAYGGYNTQEAGNEVSVTPIELTKYGVAHATTLSAPALTRLYDGAAYTATAGIGDTPQLSDFDGQPIFNDLRLCNLAIDGTVTAYEGDAGFARDGTNGNVMLEIPAFYYAIADDGDVRNYVIASGPDEGLSLHPAFSRGEGSNHINMPHIYVGAYEMGADFNSISGVTPKVSMSRANFRTNCKALGSGWYMLDIATLMAVNLLIMVEYANLDVQTVIAPGNTASGSIIATGGTDAMAGHTGRPEGTNNNVGCKWRGLENWWGNARHCVDGLNKQSRTPYVAINPAIYKDSTSTNYMQLANVTMNDGYIKTTKVNPDNPWCMIPEVGAATPSTFYCDAWYFDASANWHTPAHGGMTGYTTRAGMNCWDVNIGATSGSSTMSTRLIYLPPNS